MSLLISTAYAAEGALSPAIGGGFDIMLLMGGFVLIFYFLLWRPQTKRAKEHRQLTASLKKGDEVLVSSGVLGKITKLNEQFAEVSIADGVNIKVQKKSIAMVLPKNTLKESI